MRLRGDRRTAKARLAPLLLSAVLCTGLTSCAAPVILPLPQASPAATQVPPLAMASDAIPEGWTTYCDLEVGCTLSYPAEADLSVGRSKFGVHTIRLQFPSEEAHSHEGMVIRVVPHTEDNPLDEVLRLIYGSSAQTLPFESWREELERFTVGGLPALKTACAEGSTDFSVVIPLDDRVFVAALTHGPAMASATPQTLETFYRVLDTFVAEER